MSLSQLFGKTLDPLMFSNNNLMIKNDILHLTKRVKSSCNCPFLFATLMFNNLWKISVPQVPPVIGYMILNRDN